MSGNFSLIGFLIGPTGPKTIHFWGPVANWGFVLAGILDMNKPMERVSEKMVATLALYSAFFMRFAWRVQPRNFILFACHFCNCSAQSMLLVKKLKWNQE